MLLAGLIPLDSYPSHLYCRLGIKEKDSEAGLWCCAVVAERQPKGTGVGGRDKPLQPVRESRSLPLWFEYRLQSFSGPS